MNPLVPDYATGFANLLPGASRLPDPSNNARFVMRLYGDTLHRQPDAAALPAWVAALNTGTSSREQVASAIVSSQESHQDEVTGMFRAYLGRSPDQAGLDVWTRHLDQGGKLSGLRNELLASPEYFTKNGGANGSFLDAAYRDLLGRSPDGQGRAAWLGALVAGSTRAQVAAGISGSSERQEKVVQTSYLYYLHREVDASGKQTWTAALQAGMSEEALITKLQGSAEYFGRLRAPLRTVANPQPPPVLNLGSSFPLGTIANQVPVGTVGNQAPTSAISLGMDFDVNRDILINRLGVFASGAKTLQAPLTATVYNRDTQQAVAQLTFNVGDPNELSIDGSLFLPLATPLRLPAGFRGTIVGDGWGSTQPYADAGSATPAWMSDNGGGWISFVGNRSGTPNAFPANVSTGFANRYAAATFDFSVSANSFSAIGVGIPGLQSGSVAWGDYDNDGRLDLLVTGVDVNQNAVAAVYHNNGDGTFTDIHAGLPGVSIGSVAWGDYDNDGKLDILLTGQDNNYNAITQLFHNEGNGRFSAVNANLMGVSASSVAWGDYDNDGKLDILLTGQDNNGDPFTKLYHNNGNGTFTDTNVSLPGVRGGSVAWGDYDNDGRLDILLIGLDANSNSIARVYHNDGNGQFHDIQAGLPGVILSSAAWGDYDNDGRLDILLTGLDANSNAIARVYHNDGNGQFHDIQAGLPGAALGSVAWGDYDNDGRLDILLTGLDANGNLIARVYHNDGNGQFHDINAGLPDLWYSSVAWADYDNDGRLDIVLTGRDDKNNSSTGLYHNVSAPSPVPTIAYQVPVGTVGTQPFTGSVGNDFDVNQNALVTRLGVFVSGLGGLQQTVYAAIYSRDTQQAVTPILTFAPGDPNEIRRGGSVFLPLAPPLALPAGFHGSIVSWGYGPKQPHGDAAPEFVANGTLPVWTTADGGGVVRFVGSGRYTTTAGTYPTTLDRGPADDFAAGNFEFVADVPGPASPPADPATVLTPVAYVLVNGGNPFGSSSSSPFLDTTYQVPGQSTPPAAQQPGILLSGGLGKLTDGFVGPTDVLGSDVNASPWVGWVGGPPNNGIVFDFGQPVNVAKISLFINNSGSMVTNLPVALYDQLDVGFSNDGQNFFGSTQFITTADQKADPSARFLTYDLNRYSGAAQSGATARYVQLSLVDTNPASQWNLLSEVRFTGVASTAPLSVKRVPGYEATAPYTAVPYVVSNQNQRQISGTAVDYWEVNLRRNDSIQITVVPTSSAQPPNGFFVRILNSQYQDVGPANGGAVGTDPSGNPALIAHYTAPFPGNYFIAISSSANTHYGITPFASQPAVSSSPTSLPYNLSFATLPGPQTSLSGFWGTYQNPANAPDAAPGSNQNWPVWSHGQDNAYQVLANIAKAGAAQNVPSLLNFTDFRQVGNQANSATQQMYLAAAWTPFANLYSWRLQHPNDTNLNDENPVIQANLQFAYGYTASTWQPIGQAFLNDATAQADFLSVYNLLNNANIYRANLTTFLTGLETWTLNNKLFPSAAACGGPAELVANTIASSLQAPPQLSQAAPTSANIAVDILEAALIEGLSLAFPELAAVQIIGAGVLAGVGDLVHAGINSFYADNSNTYNPNTTASALSDAACQIDMAMGAQLTDAFNRLLKTDFLARLSSNYGLLEAFANSQFTTPQDASGTVLQAVYEQQAWQELLPRTFHWQLLNNQSNSAFGPSPGQFQNFFPNSVQATKQINHQQDSITLGGSGQTMAQAELQALASGSSYSFPGFAVADESSWYLSSSGTVNPTTSRFYTASGADISAGTADSNNMFVIDWSGSGWAVNEWALMTNQGEELGQAAANQLFASGRSSFFLLSGDGAYYDAPISSDAGFAKRSEVFLGWGQDVPGFNPASNLIPSGSSGSFGFQICTLRSGCHTELLPYNLNYTPWGASSAAARAPGGTSRNERYVIQLYRDLLHRNPDAAGLASWTSQLDKGATAGQVTQGILTSSEYRTLIVQGVYDRFLHRAANPPELADGVAFLASGGMVEQLQVVVTSSVEFLRNRGGGSAADFLEALYRDGLHRALDPSGRATYSQALASGNTHAQIADALFSSSEYRQELVQNDYQRILHRSADSSGLDTWLNFLQKGARDEDVIAGIVSSPEYLNKIVT